MFEVEKTFSFEAGHSLVHHDGKCAHPHGHSYVLQIAVRAPQLIEHGPKRGMVMDFGEISAVVKPMIEEYFDHRWLNDTLMTEMPTAEYIAQWIFDYVNPKLSNMVYSVTIFETKSNRATYYNPSCTDSSYISVGRSFGTPS